MAAGFKEVLLGGDLDAHEAAADPHTGYVKESDANWIDLTDAGETDLHSHAGGGGGTSITDADADTKVQTEEGADEDKVRVDTGGVERLVIDSVGAKFDGNIGVGVAPNANYYINASPSIAAAQSKRLLSCQPSNPAFSGNGLFIAIYGNASAYGIEGGSHQVVGLDFTTGGVASSVTCTFSYIHAISIKPGAMIAGSGKTLTCTNMRGAYFPKPTLMEISSGTLVVTNYDCIDVEDVADVDVATLTGLRIDDCTLGTVANYILELGPTPYLRLLGSGSWTPADYETPLYLAADDPAVLHQVTLGAADSGGAGFRCLRVPNL